MSDRLIYHLFADEGVESEALSAYGKVVRIGLDPKDTRFTDEVKASDLTETVPVDETADLAVLHPPCPRFSNATHATGNQDDHPNLIPRARKIGREYAAEYIIENVPGAPIHDPVILNGRMFGLPIHYERAFETSFKVEQPPRERMLVDDPGPFAEQNARGSWIGEMDLWRSVKGYSGDYNARMFKRAGIPRAYIDYLMRAFLLSEKEAVA